VEAAQFPPTHAPKAGDRSRNPLTRWLDTLFAPAGADRAVVILLAAYTAIWTLYGCIAGASQDIHSDMAELIAWSRTPAFGYLKHPPLAAWIVGFWFRVFPLASWSYYLLAALMPSIALWFSWRIGADYLSIEKRVAGLALLMLIPFYNFHALKFNANSVLLPCWAATTYWFFRAHRTQSTGFGALAGLGAAACMLGKYWSVFLLVGLAIAALSHPRRWAYFRSPAPWIASVAGVALIAPHLVWLYWHDFPPLEYALAHHGEPSMVATIRDVAGYLLGSAAYVALPVLLTLIAARPDRSTLRDMLVPSDPDRRFAAVSFWGPLLLPAAAAPVAGIDLTPLWSMPAWTLLPVVLLSPWRLELSRDQSRTILIIVCAATLLMLAIAPGVALAVHRAGIEPPAAHGRQLAGETERAWRDVTTRPLRHVGCDAAEEVAAYATDRPQVLPSRIYQGDIADVVYADFRHWPLRTATDPTSQDPALATDGMALVCFADHPNRLAAAAARAARNPASLRREIELRREFMGFAGPPQRYVIFVIPPPR
jgi:hypothetical protein